MSPPKGTGWIWQATHEANGWYSQSKTQRLIAFVVSTFIIVYVVIKGNILPLLPELLGVYLAYAVLGRAASRYMSERKNKQEASDDRQDSLGV